MSTHEIGSVIQGKYELTGLLGRGGMGVVYAAINRDLGSPVALKFLNPANGDTAEVVARFRREATLASRLNSEHVARVFDIVTNAAGESFIVMERLQGRDLAKLLAERGPLPVSEVADLLLQACEAIAEVHLLGIVHRDSKPANIFVTRPAHGRDLVKVLDFGIAKSTAPDEPAMTAGAAVIGSPRYMSPEQLNAVKDIDARSDVWSLGVIVYELLTGKPPFSGNGFGELCAAIQRGDPPELSEHREGLPEGLEELVSECLLVDRDARIASVAAFAARLAAFGSTAAQASLERITGFAAGSSSSPPAGPALDAPVGGDITTKERAATVVTNSRATVTTRRWPLPALLAALGVVVAGAALRSRGSPDAPAPNVPSEAACAARQPGACLALAAVLAKNTSVTRDVERARELYKSECDVGTLVACNALGALYGAARDYVKAVVLYDRACKGGLARGCLNLGSVHYDVGGALRNDELATHEFLGACEGGEPLGCYNLAAAYAEGRGVKKDFAKSLMFARRACDGGAPEGCARVMAASVKGEGTTQDIKGGLAGLDDACTRGQGASCSQLQGITSVEHPACRRTGS